VDTARLFPPEAPNNTALFIPAIEEEPLREVRLDSKVTVDELVAKYVAKNDRVCKIPMPIGSMYYQNLPPPPSTLDTMIRAGDVDASLTSSTDRDSSVDELTPSSAGRKLTEVETAREKMEAMGLHHGSVNSSGIPNNRARSLVNQNVYGNCLLVRSNRASVLYQLMRPELVKVGH
jgi:hypothetical protein